MSSQLEAVRLERQRVEVQLTMAQSKGRACKQAALEKEGKWNATHEGLKGACVCVCVFVSGVGCCEEVVIAFL